MKPYKPTLNNVFFFRKKVFKDRRHIRNTGGVDFNQNGNSEYTGFQILTAPIPANRNIMWSPLFRTPNVTCRSRVEFLGAGSVSGCWVSLSVLDLDRASQAWCCTASIQNYYLTDLAHWQLIQLNQIPGYSNNIFLKFQDHYIESTCGS